MEQALDALPLPSDVADVLHLLDTTPEDPSTWWWKALLALALLFLLWRRLRRRKPPQVQPPSVETTPIEASPSSGLDGDIADLLSEIDASGRYRQGCHRLASLLRRAGEDEASRPMTRWTYGDFVRHLGDEPLSRLIGLLGELQFSPEEPSRGDFEGACELATDLSRQRQW